MERRNVPCPLRLDVGLAGSGEEEREGKGVRRERRNAKGRNDRDGEVA